MTGRQMLILFEDLLRTTSPELQFDINIDTKLIYDFLTKAQEEYISSVFLLGDSMADNINAIRKRSDVLRNIIKRSTATTSSANRKVDGGFLAKIDADDYWMYLSGIMNNDALSVSSIGSSIQALELELINHYDLSSKIRTVNNEPILINVPIVLEGDDEFIYYLSKEYEDQITLNGINNTTFDIIYLAFPASITGSDDCKLSASTHKDIVKLAVNNFVAEYKYKLGLAANKEKSKQQ